MTQATSQASETAQLPTIIIDPSLYEADVPLPKQTARGSLSRLARVTLLTGAVGGATVGLAHLLIGDSFLQDLRVAALTKLLGPADNDAALHAAASEEPSAHLAQPAKTAVAMEPAAAPDVVRAEQPQAPLPESPSEHQTPAREAPTPAPIVAARPLPVGAASARPAPNPIDAASGEVAHALVRPPVAAKHVPVAAAAARPLAGAPRVDVEASIRNARRLQALNQLDEAEAAYQAVLAQSGEQSAALIGLARIRLSRGQLDAALDFARRAAQQSPDQASVHLTLGDVLRARGDQPGAQAEYALAK